MIARTFSSEEAGVEALKEAGQGYVLVPSRWTLRLPSWDERENEEVFEKEAVSVSIATFQTSVDLHEDAMRDEDWISLGKMVVHMARASRQRQ